LFLLDWYILLSLGEHFLLIIAIFTGNVASLSLGVSGICYNLTTFAKIVDVSFQQVHGE
jgi:hypothetical protein